MEKSPVLPKDPRLPRSFVSRLKRRAAKMRRRLWALALAWKDPATPWIARVAIACAIGYALSPIDLIPDFIPVLGQLDDLVIVPALIALALRLIPAEVAARSRREAWKRLKAGEGLKSPAAIVASAIFIAVWLALIYLVLTRAIGLGRHA